MMNGRQSVRNPPLFIHHSSFINITVPRQNELGGTGCSSISRSLGGMAGGVGRGGASTLGTPDSAGTTAPSCERTRDAITLLFLSSVNSQRRRTLPLVTTVTYLTSCVRIS